MLYCHYHYYPVVVGVVVVDDDDVHGRGYLRMEWMMMMLMILW